MKEMSQDTLEKLTEARNYNRWVYNLCRSFLGSRLLEVGCGIGNMTEYFIGNGRFLATDIQPGRLRDLEANWSGRLDFSTAVWDITRTPPPDIRGFRPDTLLCINLLEHVADDRLAMQNLYQTLEPGGHLLLYVPALSFIYGTLDEELGHVRRYTPRTVRHLMTAAGFRLHKMHYVNFFGIAGWWLNGRVLKRRHFSRRQIHLYDNLIPALAFMEKIFKPVVGQSLFAVGEK